MGTMAKLILICNVGAEPNRGETAEGKPYANFRGAHSYTKRAKNEGDEPKKITTWYSVSAFGETAKAAAFIKKGSKVYIEGGEPKIETFGQKISIAVTASRIVLLDRKPAEVDDEIPEGATAENDVTEEAEAAAAPEEDLAAVTG